MTEVRPLHRKKAEYSILVTELGIVTEVRPLHSLKAHFPILVTELGIVIEVRPLHSEKAKLPILVTEYFEFSKVINSGITMSPEYLLSPSVTVAFL